MNIFLILTLVLAGVFLYEIIHNIIRDKKDNRDDIIASLKLTNSRLTTAGNNLLTINEILQTVIKESVRSTDLSNRHLSTYHLPEVDIFEPLPEEFLSLLRKELMQIDCQLKSAYRNGSTIYVEASNSYESFKVLGESIADIINNIKKYLSCIFY